MGCVCSSVGTVIPDTYKALDSIPGTLIELTAVVVPNCKPNIPEVDGGRPKVQDHPHPHSKFKASLDSVRPFKNKNQNNNNKRL